MNNPQDFPVDVAAERQWVHDHRSARGLSWAALARLSGIPQGTLSGWIEPTYRGNPENIARKVFQYRQTLEAKETRLVGLPTDPGYLDTPTARRLEALMVWAHRGRMTLAATGPGTGKTMATRHYKASASNVYVATLEESSKSLNSMIMAVLRSLNIVAKGGWGSQLSQLVVDNLAGRGALLIIDEANHATREALEQIRAWHDACGVGICLLGNEELMMRIEGGRAGGRDAYGRLNSRIAQRHLQHQPLAEDVAVFCDAWGILDDGMRGLLSRIALTPGSGGLRECQQIIEQASILAVDDERPLSLADLRDAQSQRATRLIK